MRSRSLRRLAPNERLGDAGGSGSGRVSAAAGPRVLIAGAGIGGLAAGIALARAGIEATVFERAPDLNAIQVGYGIHLWTNATRALESLEDADNLPPPDVLAAEIVEDLEAALIEFAEIARTLSPANGSVEEEIVRVADSET